VQATEHNGSVGTSASCLRLKRYSSCQSSLVPSRSPTSNREWLPPPLCPRIRVLEKLQSMMPLPLSRCRIYLPFRCHTQQLSRVTTSHAVEIHFTRSTLGLIWLNAFPGIFTSSYPITPPNLAFTALKPVVVAASQYGNDSGLPMVPRWKGFIPCFFNGRAKSYE